jgi:hypothetical protein
MLNKTWAIITRGKTWTVPRYGRRTGDNIYKENPDMVPILDLFVPYRDNLLQSHYTNQCIELIQGSIVSDRFEAFDTLNTYTKAPLQYPTPGVVEDSPIKVISTVAEDAFTNYGDGILRLNCDVIVGTPSITTRLGTQTFTMTNGLSSVITLLDGFDIRFNQPLPGGDFSFTIEFTAEPNVDWQRILELAESQKWSIPDADLRNIYNQDAFWNNRLAALLLNAVENSTDG